MWKSLPLHNFVVHIPLNFLLLMSRFDLFEFSAFLVLARLCFVLSFVSQNLVQWFITADKFYRPMIIL